MTHPTAKLLCQTLLPLLSALTLASPARASCDDVCKIFKSATDAATKDANAAADKLIAAARSQSGDILNTANADARTIKDTANRQSGAIAAEAQRAVAALQANSLAIGNAEYATLASAYARSLRLAGSAADVLAKTVQTAATLAPATAANLRDAGAIALNKESAKLLALQASLNSLDSEGQQALNRVMRAIPKGQIDSQSMCDVPRLAKKLGLLSGSAAETAFGATVGLGQSTYDQNIPGVPAALANSNFSLCLGGAGAYGIGGNASVCFAMEVAPSTVPRNEIGVGGKSRAYKMAVVQTVGGSVGLGASIGPSLAWSPGAINTKVTPNIGLEGGLGPVGIGMSWDVALKDMTAIPGFSLGIGGVGTPASWSIDAGVSIPLYKGYGTFSK